jgi:NodT family efflux transporter outer membrane factor (OMF) lipoprotein
MNWTQRTVFVATLLLLGACSTQKPMTGKALRDQALPQVNIPNQFSVSTPSGPALDQAWLKQFNDTELNELVAEALKNHPDIRVMAARRLQAQALIDAAGGAQYPGVGVIGNTGGRVGSSGTGLTGYYIGANWELDLWGRVRNQVAGAQQNARALNAEQEAAQLSLIGTLTKTVWLARGLQEQARLAQENADAAARYAELTVIREQIGASSKNDVALASANAAQSKEGALIAKQSRDQALRAVEILVGRYPHATPLKTTQLPALPPPVAAGIPADILERRPDIIAAEARVNSAFYAAAEKRVARLPKISLTAGFGYINSQVFSLINGPTSSLGVGANVMLPLFQGGAIEAQIAYQNAEAQAALANYGKVVLNAFGDVENALNGEMTWRERTLQLQTQLREQKQILKNTEQEFIIGRIDQRQIQQQKIKTNTTEINFRQGQVDALTQRVNLYLALGGSPTP